MVSVPEAKYKLKLLYNIFRVRKIIIADMYQCNAEDSMTGAQGTAPIDQHWQENRVQKWS
jgi:hypothetical protein